MSTTIRFLFAALAMPLVLAVAFPLAASADDVLLAWSGKVRYINQGRISVYSSTSRTAQEFILNPDTGVSTDNNVAKKISDVKVGAFVTVKYEKGIIGDRQAKQIVILPGGNMTLSIPTPVPPAKPPTPVAPTKLPSSIPTPKK
jgi:hypothetical protein